MSASLPPQWLTQFFLDSGSVAAGAKLYSWISGTTTPTPVYTDTSGNVPLSNPAIADASGRLEFYLDNETTYKLEVQTSAGVTLVELPEISGAAPSDAFSIDSLGYRSQIVNSLTTPVILSKTLSTNVDTSQTFEMSLSVPTSTTAVSLGIVDRYSSPLASLFTVDLNSAGDSAELHLVLTVENRLIGAARTCSYALDIHGHGQLAVRSYCAGVPWRASSGDVAIGLSTTSAIDIPVTIWNSTVRSLRHE